MTTTTAARHGKFFLFAAITTLFAAASARADLLELVNGDHYNGVVIALTRTNLEFKSEIQGIVKIPRDKVARITLHEPAQRKPATNAPAGDAVNSPAAGQPNQAAQVIQQMRDQGVDPNVMNQIQQQMLGTSSPEATQMFNSTVNGLMSGSASVDDIRAQALSALKDIQAAKKDLGGDAGMNELLDGYQAILQKFVQETAPPAKAQASQARAKPAPTASSGQ